MALFARPVLKRQTVVQEPGAEDGQAEAGPARKVRGKLPEKRTINLVTVNETHINWLVAIPLILLIYAAAGAFSKFFVIDRMALADEAQYEVAQLQSQLDSVERELAEYDDVKDAYAHYTVSGMTQEELNRVDRVDVMELLERVAFPRLTVSNWSVSGNELTMSVRGETLDTINELVQGLLKEPIVSYCTVINAASQVREYRPEGAEPNAAGPDAAEGAGTEDMPLPEIVDGTVVAVLRIPPEEAQQ